MKALDNLQQSLQAVHCKEIQYVEHELRGLNHCETIGDKMRKLGFEVEYDGKTICNFSHGNMYFYASNHNTPSWKLDDVRVFER